MLDVEKRKAELFSGSAVDSRIQTGSDLTQPNSTYPTYPFTPTATTASNTTIQPSAAVGAPSPYTPYANNNTNIPTLSQPPPSSLPTPLTSSRHIDTDLNLTLQTATGNITPTTSNTNNLDTANTNATVNNIDIKSTLLPQYIASKHSSQKSNLTSPIPTIPIPMYTPTGEYMNSISKIQQDIYGTNNNSNGIYTSSSNTNNNNSSSGRGNSGNVYVSGGGDSSGVSYIGNTTLDLTKAQAEVDSITALLSYDLYNNSINTNNTNNNNSNNAYNNDIYTTSNSNSKPQRNSISSALNSVLNDTRLSLSASAGPKPEIEKDSVQTPPPHNYDLSSSSPSSLPLSKVSPVSIYETNTNSNSITQHLNKVYTNSSVKSIKQYWKQTATSTSTSAPSSSKGQNYDHPSGYNTERSLPSSATLLYTTAIDTNIHDNTHNTSNSSKGHNSDHPTSTTSTVPVISKYNNINSKNINTKILNTLTSTLHNNNNNSLQNNNSTNKQSMPISKKPRTNNNIAISTIPSLHATAATIAANIPSATSTSTSTINNVITTTATKSSNAIPTAIPEPNPTPVSASKIPRLSLTSPVSPPAHSYNSTNIADITPYKPQTTSAAISHNNDHNINTYTSTNTSISPVQTEAINDLVDRLERVAVTLEGHPHRFLSKLQSLLPLESNRLGWEGEEDIDLNQTLTFPSNNHSGKLNDTTGLSTNKNTKHKVDIQPVLVDKSSHPFHRVEVNFPLNFP